MYVSEICLPNLPFVRIARIHPTHNARAAKRVDVGDSDFIMCSHPYSHCINCAE